MPKIDQAHLDDLAYRAEALQRWFMSQDMTVAEAVETMSYLIGVTAACMAGDDHAGAVERVQSASTLALAVVFLKLEEDQ